MAQLKSTIVNGELVVTGKSTFDDVVIFGEAGVKCNGSVHLNTGAGLYGRLSDKGLFRHIAGYDVSDNLIYGQDSYVNSIGNVFYQGKTVNIKSKDSIKLSSPIAGITDREYGVNKVLWSGYAFPDGISTLYLTEAISAQPSGVILVWSIYEETDRPADYDFSYTFVPKLHAINHSGKGMCVSHLAEDGHMAKYIYVSDTTITGIASNSETKTFDNVSIKNDKFVLRYVIGV